MSKQDDGGPAFLVVFKETNEHGIKFPYVECCMSLRDWFAGQALNSLILVCGGDTLEVGETYPKHLATNAYEIADSMLAARNGDRPND